MKRVVFSLSFFLLLTFSSAFNLIKLDLAQADKLFDHDHHDDHIKPSSNGEVSSMILLPTESFPVPDHTKVSPFEEKEERQEDEFTPGELVKPGVLTPLDRIPVQMNTRFNRYPLRGMRFKHLRCHGRNQRFTRNFPQFIGENEVGAATVHEKDEDMNSNKDGVHGEVVWYRHRPRHHHRHHHRDHDVEEKNEHENEHEHASREIHLMKRLRKFLGYF